MAKKPITPPDRFKAAQNPAMWLLSAERLLSAADIVVNDQTKQEIPYFKAVDAAGIEAVTAANQAPNGCASVEISCPPPNDLPAQLLYAFAIENALKGLTVARNPGLVAPEKLSKRIRSHDLVRLAKEAHFQVFTQEEPLLKALTHVAEWAGRYPVASGLDKYANPDNPYPLDLNPDALLDWGAQHPVLRGCLDRLMRDLEGSLRDPPTRFGSIVAFRPPGVPRPQQ